MWKPTRDNDAKFDSTTQVDPFLTVSLFKRAACLVPDAAKAVSETWRARNFGIDPFLFYANGKTAVRCGVGACPVSVRAGVETNHSLIASARWRRD